MEHPQQTSELANLLAAKQGRDARVFAHATAETQAYINDNFNNSRPVTRCTPAQEPGFLEVFPRVASRPPRLLQDLETLMADCLRNNDKCASSLPLITKDRDPRMSANLTLDAKRQVLTTFVQGFSSYTELLSRIQEEFDLALNEGLRCSMENVQLRESSAENNEKCAKACADMRSKVMSGELEYRKAAFARLQELKLRMTRAVKRANAVEKELSEIKGEEARISSVVEKLKATQTSLQTSKQAELTWSNRPVSLLMMPMPVGPLSKEDVAWLEAEYVSAADLHQGAALAMANKGDEGQGGAEES
eukprot:gene11098-18714_t